MTHKGRHDQAFSGEDMLERDKGDYAENGQNYGMHLENSETT